MDSPPASLIEARDAATQIFDAALLTNWRDADAAIATVRSAAPDLLMAGRHLSWVRAWVRRIAEVQEAVSARQRVLTLDVANFIIGPTADVSSAFQTPSDIPSRRRYARSTTWCEREEFATSAFPT